MEIIQYMEFEPKHIDASADELCSFITFWINEAMVDNDFLCEDDACNLLGFWEIGVNCLDEVIAAIYEKIEDLSEVAIDGTKTTYNDILSLFEYWKSNSDGDRIYVKI